MKVCIIGNGSIGQRHLKGLSHNMKELGIKSINAFDNRKDRREQVKQEIKNINVFDDLKSAVIDVDSIFICVPTSLHITVIEEINKYGNFHFFIEKPLSHNLNGCDELIFSQNRAGKQAFVGYMLRFHPLIMRAKKIIESGKLGKILNVRTEAGFYLPYWHPWEDYRDFYMSWKIGGGGALLDISHEIDYLQFLFGKIQNVTGFVGTVSDLDISSDDLTSSILRFENSIIAELHLDLLQFDEARGSKIIGTEGVLKFNLMNNELAVFKKDQKDWKVENIKVNYDEDVYFEEYKAVINSFRENKPIEKLATLQQSSHVMQVIEAIKLSSSLGSRISLPIH